jgi:hypothetical protein
MLRTTGSASRRIDPPRVRDAAVRPRSRSSAAKTVREYTIDHDRATSARCAWQRRGFGPGEGHNNTATSEITSRSAPAIMVCRSPRHRARRRPRADRSAGHGSRARSSREGSCHPARCPKWQDPSGLAELRSGHALLGIRARGPARPLPRVWSPLADAPRRRFRKLRAYFGSAPAAIEELVDSAHRDHRGRCGRSASTRLQWVPGTGSCARSEPAG